MRGLGALFWEEGGFARALCLNGHFRAHGRSPPASTQTLHACTRARHAAPRWRKVRRFNEGEPELMKYSRIDGNTVLDEREQRIAEFNRPGSGAARRRDWGE